MRCFDGDVLEMKVIVCTAVILWEIKVISDKGKSQCLQHVLRLLEVIKDLWQTDWQAKNTRIYKEHFEVKDILMSKEPTMFLKPDPDMMQPVSLFIQAPGFCFKTVWQKLSSISGFIFKVLQCRLLEDIVNKTWNQYKSHNVSKVFVCYYLDSRLIWKLIRINLNLFRVAFILD